jgi:hypothetical protein
MGVSTGTNDSVQVLAQDSDHNRGVSRVVAAAIRRVADDGGILHFVADDVNEDDQVLEIVQMVPWLLRLRHVFVL